MFKEILLPVDLQQTALSERSVAAARELAAHSNANITALTVIPDFGMPLVASYFPANAMKKAKNDVAKELKRFVERNFDKADKIKQLVTNGSPHKVVVEYATENPTDLIIVPARAGDTSLSFLGSSCTHIVERAPCTVMVIRSG